MAPDRSQKKIENCIGTVVIVHPNTGDHSGFAINETMDNNFEAYEAYVQNQSVSYNLR